MVPVCLLTLTAGCSVSDRVVVSNIFVADLLTVSDWMSNDVPGGPIGQELMYNFVKVQPYFPE